VGGLPEIIDDGVDGILVPPGDSRGLQDAVAAVLTTPELRQRLTGAGRKKAEAHFSSRDMVRRYDEVYAELVERVGLFARSGPA
jgi:glycosyltransferase involved in cell wall biosynthesis